MNIFFIIFDNYNNTIQYCLRAIYNNTNVVKSHTLIAIVMSLGIYRDPLGDPGR